MGKQYTVKPDYDDVRLPDGKTYRSGATVILSTANVALLDASMTSALTLVNASVSDPAAPPRYQTVTNFDDVKAALADLDARVTAAGH